MILLSISSNQQRTGGYRYNGNIARELAVVPGFSYILEKKELVSSPRRIQEYTSSGKLLILDSIVFAYPELLQAIITQLANQESDRFVLLLHWLPWVEAQKLREEAYLEHEHFPADTVTPVPVPEGRALDTLGQFSRFIVSSRYSSGYLQSLGIESERICEAVPGLDRRLFTEHGADAGALFPGTERDHDNVFRFATVSHWTPVKGIHRLLPLFKKLSDCNWEWHAVGDSNCHTAYGKNILQEICSSSYRDRCILHGALPADFAWRIVKDCNCLLLPSLFETYGMAAAESTALGVPVIAMDTGGVAEAVRDGSDGILCKTTDVFRKTVREAAVNPEILPSPDRCCGNRKEQTWKRTAAIIRSFLLGERKN